MGTNYFLRLDPCEHCFRSDNVLHIGKSSGGWCFSLHVDPYEKLTSLEDWKAKWATPGARIFDEYDREISIEEMLKIITQRGNAKTENKFRSGDWDVRDGVPGPNGLIRHALGQYCVGHGEGTWDLIPGQFS